MLHRVLIVGAGSIGERHLRCFNATGRTHTSVCEINAEVRQSISRRYPATGIYADLATALATSPTIVVICTPAHLHVPMALAAVRQGSHVLIEKPLSTTLEGVAELIHEVHSRRAVTGVAYVYRAHPALAAMRAAIQSGRFGEPVQVVATCGQHFPFYRPAYRTIYYNDRATGGGAVQDALTHIINAAEWLVGPVTRLAADIGHQVLEGVTVEDTAHVLTRHGSVMGCFSLNQHQPPNETTLTVNCSRGATRFEFHESRWQWADEPGGSWITEPATLTERDALFHCQAAAFLDAVEGSGLPLCTLEEAWQTLSVNLAIFRAAERGNWETITATH